MTTEFPVVERLESPGLGQPTCCDEFTCPGDSHTISRATHLSRLATFFPACRDCVHRSDTGGLAKTTVGRLQKTQHRIARPTLFTDEGVRGVHRNELTRADADRLVSALAWLTWQDRPARLGDDPQSRPVPLFVVGHDSRPASRDLLAGVLAALVRSGSRALEIGNVSDACFRFAVDHLQADAGIRVTGDGQRQSFVGLDAVTRHGLPLSRRAGLENWETAADNRHPRPARRAGHRRAFQATDVYEATLKRHLIATRPLTICLVASKSTQHDSLVRLLQPLPWTLVTPDSTSHHRPDSVQDLSRLTQFHQADLGISWDHTQHGPLFCDETGTAVDPVKLFLLLATRILALHPGRTVALPTSGSDDIASIIRQLGGRPRSYPGSTRASTWQAIQRHDAVIGLDRHGAIWCSEHAPTHDPLLVVAHLLQTLDRHNQPLSQLIARRDPAGDFEI